MRMRSCSAIVFVCLLLAGTLFGTGEALAQTITGRITGSVLDQSGAAVPGASVTALNVATGVNTTTRSDQSGIYNFQFLPIGNYTVTATAAGFQKTTVGPLTLEIDQIARIDVKLTVGQV